MVSFFDRLLSSPFLRRSHVETDAKGRVTHVSATLSAEASGQADREAPEAALPAAPVPDEAESAARQDAVRWLDDAALRSAHGFALGEERYFELDQGTGTLTLHHGDGAVLSLTAQILGSFRPQDRSFRWAWANTNVAPELTETARAAREAMEHEAFKELTFKATFVDAKALAAVAAKRGGCDGVYRAVADDHLTVFVGYRHPRAPLPELAVPGTEADAEQAIAFVDAYDSEMLPYDARAHEAEREGEGWVPSEVLDQVIEGKMAVYQRYWRRDDEYWVPSSVGWPSEHDPAEQKRRFAIPRRAGGMYVVTEGAHVPKALVLERFEDAWRITDVDLDWGKGLLLVPRQD